MKMSLSTLSGNSQLITWDDLIISLEVQVWTPMSSRLYFNRNFSPLWVKLVRNIANIAIIIFRFGFCCFRPTSCIHLKDKNSDTILGTCNLIAYDVPWWVWKNRWVGADEYANQCLMQQFLVANNRWHFCSLKIDNAKLATMKSVWFSLSTRVVDWDS